MKELKTYEDLKEFAEEIMKISYAVPSNLILNIELPYKEYCELMTGVPYIQYNQYNQIATSDSFTLKYAMLTFKITIKQ